MYYIYAMYIIYIYIMRDEYKYTNIYIYIDR